jgi:arginase
VRRGYRDGVAVLRVPYHLDEYLPDLDTLLEAQQEIAPVLPAGDVWDRLAVLYSAVGQAVADSARRGSVPVVVSGDCTTSLGIVAGLQQDGADPAIVWFDAHGDVQTLETTTSGYLGGLPLRLLMGYRPGLIGTRLGLRPVPEDRVLLAGARDLDPPEAAYLAGAQVHRTGVTSLTPASLPGGPLYVHLDLDVIDPGELPALRYPAPGGVTSAQLTAALRTLLGTGRVAAVGVACTWPPGHPAPAALARGLAGALGAS